MGPFTLEARRQILEGLLQLEIDTGLELITMGELKTIDKMWDEEGDLTCRRLVETYYKVKGKKLPWDPYKTPRFDEESIAAIEEVASKFDILLIINLLRKLEKINTTPEHRDEIDSIIEKIKNKYLIYKDTVNRQPVVVSKIVLSNADKSYFEAIVNNCAITAERASHKKLKKAFDKIQKYINDIVDKITELNDKIDVISMFEDIVHNNCTIIFIDADSRETAYKLFQVLNDRGAGLTEGDLLKSKTLEVLEKHFLIKQEALQIAWDEILKDDPKQVETFLRYYFASVCGSRVGRTSLYDEFLKSFFPSIVDKDEITNENEAIEISDTVTTLLSELCNYRKIIAGEWPFDIAQPITEWDRKRLYVLIHYLNFDIVHPLLLAAVKLGHKKFAEIVYLLEKFMFRYKSVCNLPHQKLSEIYMKEAVKIRQDPSNYRVSSLKSQLRIILNTDCPDDVFKVALSNLRYHTTGGNKQIKYLFSMLASPKRESLPMASHSVPS